ncbi:MAG: HsdR family type I site-specific deoxyribonuclease [bacterium]|nr:HsdR family type I site-specific deoxyribonuclease [bacterium]
MPEALKQTQALRFDQMAVQVKDKVKPAEANVDRYVGLEHIDPESLKIRRWGETSDVESSKIIFKSGDIIFGKRRAYQRKLAVADFDGICSAHAMVLRPKADVVLDEFLPFFMQSDDFMDRAVKISVGGLSPTINWRDLAKEEFVLPLVETQQQIAKVLQASRHYVERLADVSRVLEKTSQSTIDRLVEQSVADSPKHCRFGSAPHQTTIALDDAAQITDCKHRTPELVDAGVPMVAPGDIRWGEIELESCKRIAATEYPSFMDHVAVQEGDLVLSRNQSFGIASYVTTDTRFALGQDTVLLQPALYTSSYIYLMLKSTFVQRQILRYAAGSTFGRINLGDIRRLRLPKADSQSLKTAHRIWTRLESSLQAAANRSRIAAEKNAMLVNQLTSGGGTYPMTFNEANTVEAFVRDLLCGGITHHTAVGPGLARHTGQIPGLGWHYLSHQNLPRQPHEALAEDCLGEALIRLNPTIAAQPDRVDDVLYRLRAIIMGVRSDGLVKANEEFAAWLTGEKSMPFGENGEHVTIKLIDFYDIEQNQYVVTQQYTFRAGKTEKRADLVLLINGMPLVLIEAKTPVRSSQSWLDGALQVHDDYERNVPELFVPNAFSIATEGKEYRYGSIRMPVEFWGPWRLEDGDVLPSMEQVEKAVTSMLRPQVILDLLANFTSYATHKGKQRIKIIARYQQYEGANKLVERVVAGHPKKGLIWHFQGSGKSLLMLFAARKLRLHPALKNPTVMVVVDRIDLDSQISSTFYAADAPNLVKAESRKDLQELLGKDVRKIIITTIHKFGEADGVLNERDNIIVLVDEAHRTQEGDLGRKMRDSLPNAFLFGLTGTPINRADKNTFYAFGAEEDANGYMSRYGFEDSIRDGATKELHFEPRLVDLHVDQAQIDEEFRTLTTDLSDEERDQLSKKAAKMAVLLKSPARVQVVCADIAQHFQEKVAPNRVLKNPVLHSFKW